MNLGTLEYEVVANVESVQSNLTTAIRKIREFSDMAKQSGGNFNQAFDKIDEVASENNAALRKLEEQMKSLREEASKAFEFGDDATYQRLNAQISVLQKEASIRKSIKKEIDDNADALAEEEKKWEERVAKIEKNEKAHNSLRAKIRETKEAIASLRQENGDVEAISALEAKLAKLYDLQSDIQSKTKVLADDQFGFKAASEGAQVLTSTFGALTGVMGLFGQDQEKILRIMQKVQAAEAISNNLKQISIAFDKDHGYVYAALTKAKKAYTTATLAMAGALKISTGAAKGLMAALTGGLGIAITAAITLITKLISKHQEQAKAQEEMIKAQEEAWNRYTSEVSSNASKQIMQYDLLRDSWKKLDSDQAKAKWAKNHTKELKEIGIQQTDVNSLENKFSTTGANDFVNSIMKRAKALALQKALMEEYEKQIQATLTSEKIKETYSKNKKDTSKPQRTASDFMPPGAYYSSSSYKTSNEEANENLINKLSEQYGIAVSEIEQLINGEKKLVGYDESRLESLKQQLATIKKQGGANDATIKSETSANKVVSYRVNTYKQLVEWAERYQDYIEQSDNEELIEQFKVEAADNNGDMSKTAKETVDKLQKYFDDYMILTPVEPEINLEKIQQEIEEWKSEIEAKEKFFELPPIEIEEPEVDWTSEWLDDFENKVGETTDEIDNQIAAVLNGIANLEAQEDPDGLFKGTLDNLHKMLELLKIAKKEKEDLEDKKGIQDIADEFQEVLRTVSSILDTASQLSTDDWTSELMGDLSDLSNAGAQVASGLATFLTTGNPLELIEASVEALKAGAAVAADFINKKNKEAIEKSKKMLEELEKASKRLAQGSVQSLQNSYKQIDEYTKQATANANSNKGWGGFMNKLSGKYKETKEAAEEARKQAEELAEQMREFVFGGEGAIEDTARDLADSIVSAFEAGDDAVKAFGESVRQTIRNIVKNLMVNTLIVQPIMDIMNKYGTILSLSLSQEKYDAFEKYMGKMTNEINQFGEQIPFIQEQMQNALSSLGGLELSDNTNTLSGALANASQESIDLLAGVMNAVRFDVTTIKDSLNRGIEALIISNSNLVAINMTMQTWQTWQKDVQEDMALNMSSIERNVRLLRQNNGRQSVRDA
jgi:predicted  nucleic acid-binding Zn-ribbon protein|nr:MAG TPA_asm: chromosome segregation ATPase [Caudoviricetes sp.]